MAKPGPEEGLLSVLVPKSYTCVMVPDCPGEQDLSPPRAHRLTEGADRSRGRDNICLPGEEPGNNNPSPRTEICQLADQCPEPGSGA